MAPLKDMTSQRFGRLLVLRRHPENWKTTAQSLVILTT
jgi:hypothetical protein